NTMAEQNVPAQPPIRTDEQIVPRSQWLTIGKSNLLIVSVIRVFFVYQLWRAILFLAQPVLDGKDFWQADLQMPLNICRWESLTQSKSEEPKEKVELLPSPLWTNDNSDPDNRKPIQQSSYYQVSENGSGETRKPLMKVQDATCNKGATPKNPTNTPHHQQESIPQRKDDDLDLDLAKKLSLEAHQEKGEEEGSVSEATPKLHEVVGKGKAVVSEEQVAHSLIDLSKKKRTTDRFILKDWNVKTEAAALKVDKNQDELDTGLISIAVFTGHSYHINARKATKTNHHISSLTSLIHRPSVKSGKMEQGGLKFYREYSVLCLAPSLSRIKNPERDEEIINQKTRKKNHKRKHECDDDEDDDDVKALQLGSKGSLTHSEAGVDSSLHRLDPNQKFEHNLQMTFQSRAEGNDSDMETLTTLTFPRVGPLYVV
ncbi:hypothetical protein Tco_0898196, partial [Tanacetum coccineum]